MFQGQDNGPAASLAGGLRMPPGHVPACDISCKVRAGKHVGTGAWRRARGAGKNLGGKAYAGRPTREGLRGPGILLTVYGKPTSGGGGLAANSDAVKFVK
jgi:hypothetical protein